MKKLPNASNARIDSTKLTGYLLSEAHPVGRSKALFFKAIGYELETATALRLDLLLIAETGKVIDKITSAFGDKYVVEGMLVSPTGKKARLRTVWLLEQGVPRLISAYPVRDR